MYWVYALSSLNRNYIYVGMTQDIEQRISRHNNGLERTTKPYAPFVLLYKEVHPNRIEARKREKFWKSGVGKEQLREIKNTL
ncbi:GIY-YIG nuclease family protein [Aureisphaera sp. CAU 1614]|uniref:GIY-YIG nuclease family protein n=1 Tax=Halomarinibacterium sedimenti TaxID=2857106 RepID=A0A9X1JXW2_9FLAO|nr:GIY-YIG nuclease family protein [Halomarinibacterium sedimenti]MBW2938538.1 GIY-YIG nuclease family protein [Halomarinibacterium sedimenti]